MVDKTPKVTNGEAIKWTDATLVVAMVVVTAWVLAVVAIAATVKAAQTTCRPIICAIVAESPVTKSETAHAMVTRSTTLARPKASLRITSGALLFLASSSIKIVLACIRA